MESIPCTSPRRDHMSWFGTRSTVLTKGYGFRNSSGSFAMFAAIRRASHLPLVTRGWGKILVVADLRHAHSLVRAAFKIFVPDCFDEMSQWRLMIFFGMGAEIIVCAP